MSERIAIVTGASGFVGTHVVTRLRADGWYVRAVTRRPDAVDADDVVAWRDITDDRAIRGACEGADVVVHLAAHAHVFGGSAESDSEKAQGNVSGSGIVATAARGAGVRRMLLVSSVGASAIRPENVYARSKLASEERVRENLLGSQTELVVVRPPLIYGEGMKGRPLRLFQLVSRGLPLPSVANSNVRSVAYAGNVAASVSFLVAPTTPAPSDPIYPADVAPISTANLIRAIAESLGVSPRVIRVPSALVYLVASVGTITRRKLVPVNLEDVRRAGETLVVDVTGAYPGGVAPFTTQQGLQRTARWFQGIGR